MKKILSRLIWLPVGAVFVLFLVANRQLVSISLDPISTDDPALTTPALWLWFWLVLSLLFGLALGAAGMWLSARPSRELARESRREVKALRQEIAALKAGGPTETLPALDAQ